MDRRTVASLIDHTLLKPDATLEAIARLCREAREYRFGTVCVQPFWVDFAVEELAGARIRVASVVGFPHGANETSVKVVEAVRAIESGAGEIDMVMNVGAFLSGDESAVERDIAEVADASHERNAIVKVILETGFLSDEQKRRACEISQRAGADFVKTSTGFGPGGATVGDVALLRATVGPDMGVKASGGIRTWEDCRAMMTAGANRIGTSSGIAILASISD